MAILANMSLSPKKPTKAHSHNAVVKLPSPISNLFFTFLFYILVSFVTSELTL